MDRPHFVYMILSCVPLSLWKFLKVKHMKKLGFNEFQLLSQGAAPFLLLKEPQLLPAATTIGGVWTE